MPPTGANLDPIRAGPRLGKQIIDSRPLISGSFGAYGSGCPPSTSQQIDTRLECVCVCVSVAAAPSRHPYSRRGTDEKKQTIPKTGFPGMLIEI